MYIRGFFCCQEASRPSVAPGCTPATSGAPPNFSGLCIIARYTDPQCVSHRRRCKHKSRLLKEVLMSLGKKWFLPVALLVITGSMLLADQPKPGAAPATQPTDAK